RCGPEGPTPTHRWRWTPSTTATATATEPRSGLAVGPGDRCRPGRISRYRHRRVVIRPGRPVVAAYRDIGEVLAPAGGRRQSGRPVTRRRWSLRWTAWCSRRWR